jgi:hypothetical protein
MTTMADAFLPKFQFSERHSAHVMASPRWVLSAIDELSDADDSLVRALIMLREAPARFASCLGLPSALKHQPRFGMRSFTKLGETETEAAYGLIGRFWRPDFGLCAFSSGEEFLAFERAGVPKLVTSFCISPAETGGSLLVTETRVHCPDRLSLILFTPYWWAIRTASGFIRSRMLTAIKRKAEAMKIDFKTAFPASNPDVRGPKSA